MPLKVSESCHSLSAGISFFLILKVWSLPYWNYEEIKNWIELFIIHSHCLYLQNWIKKSLVFLHIFFAKENSAYFCLALKFPPTRLSDCVPPTLFLAYPIPQGNLSLKPSNMYKVLLCLALLHLFCRWNCSLAVPHCKA